jgi:hypothetical protein
MPNWISFSASMTHCGPADSMLDSVRHLVRPA